MVARPSRCSRLALAWVACLLAIRARAAHGEELRSGSISYVAAVHRGTGTVANDIGFGGSPIGFQAAWHPMRPDQRLGWSASWTILWMRFGEQPAATVTDVLSMLEIDLTLRLRFAPSAMTHHYLTVGGGATMLRTSTRIPPDNRRDYLGPAFELGYEYLWDRVLVGVHLRLGPVFTGPSIASGLLSLGVTF
jgi:hypothetical protein